MPYGPDISARQRSVIGRAAVEKSWAFTADRAARTQPARDAFARRFEHEVDPHSVLEPDERTRRPEHARRAYFASLSAKSARARRMKRRAAS